YTGDDVKGDIDELLLLMPLQSVGNLRFIEAIVGKGLSHATLGCAEAILREARTGIQSAGCDELSVHRRAFGASYSDDPDELPGRAAEDKLDTVAILRGIGFDIFEETCGKKL